MFPPPSVVNVMTPGDDHTALPLSPASDTLSDAEVGHVKLGCIGVDVGMGVGEDVGVGVGVGIGVGIGVDIGIDCGLSNSSNNPELLVFPPLEYDTCIL